MLVGAYNPGRTLFLLAIGGFIGPIWHLILAYRITNGPSSALFPQSQVLSLRFYTTMTLIISTAQPIELACTWASAIHTVRAYQHLLQTKSDPDALATAMKIGATLDDARFTLQVQVLPWLVLMMIAFILIRWSSSVRTYEGMFRVFPHTAWIGTVFWGLASISTAWAYGIVSYGELVSAVAQRDDGVPSSAGRLPTMEPGGRLFKPLAEAHICSVVLLVLGLGVWTLSLGRACCMTRRFPPRSLVPVVQSVREARRSRAAIVEGRRAGRQSAITDVARFHAALGNLEDRRRSWI